MATDAAAVVVVSAEAVAVNAVVTAVVIAVAVAVVTVVNALSAPLPHLLNDCFDIQI